MRWFLACLLVVLSRFALAAESKPSWQIEWEKTLAAAEKEGQVTAYIFQAGPLTPETVQAFEKAYPKIKVNQLRGRGSDLGPRIIAERRAGKFLVDVFAGGKGTAYSTLYIGKALDPIKPLLILPEVVDETRWWEGRHKYVDPERKYIFAYIGNGGGVEINYNTSLVSPKEFKSYWDLVNPKWQGKIVATDPRVRGMDTPVLFFYYHPNLGPEFLKKLYGEMEVTVSRDYRHPIDWLAVGKFSLCIPCVSDEMDRAMRQGLPVGQILDLKEGGTLSSSGGTLSFLNNAPHPNAAKVFINWLLSREGQAQVQKGRKDRPGTGSNSLRIDIPKDDVPAVNQRKPEVQYFDGDDPRFSDRRPADRLFDEIFGKAAK
ncbi:MAG TPA: extracellular solute-binding protein [Candidatus Acidoferrales bacterium]|nr:extracellular solute-binding protein [Candidatus Acidoferrales bacterium]